MVAKQNQEGKGNIHLVPGPNDVHVVLAFFFPDLPVKLHYLEPARHFASDDWKRTNKTELLECEVSSHTSLAILFCKSLLAISSL
jgi:hypothetical protein